MEFYIAPYFDSPFQPIIANSIVRSQIVDQICLTVLFEKRALDQWFVVITPSGDRIKSGFRLSAMGPYGCNQFVRPWRTQFFRSLGAVSPATWEVCSVGFESAAGLDIELTIMAAAITMIIEPMSKYC